jgi:antitoxin HicB
MKTASKKSEIPHYLALPYTRELVREDNGSWFARVLEFPGCMTVGDSSEEALQMLDDAMAAWVESKLKDHEMIPAPMTVEEFSGRFVVRVTKSLHRDLVRAAERNGVSLNQYVVTMLAQSTGLPTPAKQISMLRKEYGATSAVRHGRKRGTRE